MSTGSKCALWLTALLLHTVTEAGEVVASPETTVHSKPLTSPPRAESQVAVHVSDNELVATFATLNDGSGTDSASTYFGTDNNTVVTSQTGSTALLPCVIHNIGDGIVSWIRRKDYHLLTVGLTTYSSDQRFQAIHLQHSEDWTLKVKYVQTRDAGVYECQVSSHPPTSIFLRLDVVEARAEISGPTEKYLKPGSTLKLLCTIIKTTEAPAFVFWYHNSRMINYDAERGVNVSTDAGARLSALTVPGAGAGHAGNYSCVPNNARPASIYVHIFNGENPAAMQSGTPCRWSNCCLNSIYITVLASAASNLWR